MPIDLLPQLVDAAIRAFGLGLFAFAGIWLFRIRSSAARHATWTVVLAGMLLQMPFGKVAPPIPLRALPAFVRSANQPRVMESARISEPAAQTLTPASRHPRRAEEQMGVITRDAQRHIPCDLDAAVCADDPRMVGFAPNPPGVPSPSPLWVPVYSNRSH